MRCTENLAHELENYSVVFGCLLPYWWRVLLYPLFNFSLLFCKVCSRSWPSVGLALKSHRLSWDSQLPGPWQLATPIANCGLVAWLC